GSQRQPAGGSGDTGAAVAALRGPVRRRPGRGRPRPVRVWPIGARLDWAVTTSSRTGQIELIAGNRAAAERYLREGCQTLRAMGERAFLCSALARLTEAVYRQGPPRRGTAADRGSPVSPPADDYNGQARWRATRAWLLARRGQFP